MVWFAIAIALQFVVGYFYVLSGLVAPAWAVAILAMVWAALTVVLLRVRRQGPKILLIPLGAAALWFAVLWAGDTFLGWTA